VRACGVGLAIACSRPGSAVGAFLLALAALLVGMIVSIAWAPETKHLTLSQASGG
jgi:putative MFS transporter